MEHLIADSGIQFLTTEMELNPQEPLALSSGKTLKYTFYETVDPLEDTQTFGLLCAAPDGQRYVPASEVAADETASVRRPNGRVMTDEAGVTVMSPKADLSFFTSYTADDPDIYSVSSLQSLRAADPKGDGHAKVAAFEALLDKWLPVPMFQKEVDGASSYGPTAWCRVKIRRTGDGSRKGTSRYRLVWAFDTATSDDELSTLRPSVPEYAQDAAGDYAMCSRADMLVDFLSSQGESHAFADYIASLLGIDTAKDTSCKYKAYYIYLLNLIRLAGAAPEVTLHDNRDHDIPVDLVIDMGNSRTCGLLFEQGLTTKGTMLELVDLSRPWVSYQNRAFDMRVVFRRADFGDDIGLDEPMFKWPSFVRVGEEAKRLVYRSLEQEGLADKTTNYSSPKRYIWDDRPFDGQWENLVTVDDPDSVRLNTDIHVPVLSDMFDGDGTFKDGDADAAGRLSLDDDARRRYSRSSLMTFALIEIFMQATTQVNSVRYRDKWGDKDCRRHIRKVIMTCPTAMPQSEQTRLRKCAEQAYKAVSKCVARLPIAKVIPSSAELKATFDLGADNHRAWTYDEATCCQLVYLYAEIGEKYKGETRRFFEQKGHERPALKEEGYEGKALTIGSVDIGAGTTDLMVCAYECTGDETCKITPVPLFWDSFYLAGDDILRNLVQNLVIEGREHGQADTGNISAALLARTLAKTDDELRDMAADSRYDYKDSHVYQAKIRDIIAQTDPDKKRGEKAKFTANLIHDFFGKDSSMMGYVARRVRNDFNTQVSVPLAQFMLEQLRTRRPSRLYTYDDIFPDVKPAPYLLDYFERHFAFRLEELSWRYDPDEVASIVKSTMEPLMRQLALVLYAQRCDVIVLSGRPTSLDALTELFIKYVPTSPDRLVRLNDYHVGSWFPTADGQGYFYDQKSIVAVGGMIGHLASEGQLSGFTVDLSRLAADMKSTANYMGEYNDRRRMVEQSRITPQQSTATLDGAAYPAYIGCRQLDSPLYQARPIYAIYNESGRKTLRIRLSRDYYTDREALQIEEVTDTEGNTMPKDSVRLVQQSLADDGKYWLDKGEFELTIK